MALIITASAVIPEAGEIAGINQLTIFHLNTFLMCDPAVDRRPGSGRKTQPQGGKTK
jgi:hypothetical protein